jgi:hypothetical protein
VGVAFNVYIMLAFIANICTFLIDISQLFYALKNSTLYPNFSML